jgi:TrmH family RNA methyltransferase
MKLIQSRDNAFFKQLRKLAESGRERRKAGQTLLDGVHLVESYEKSLPRSTPWWLPNRPSPVVK